MLHRQPMIMRYLGSTYVWGCSLQIKELNINYEFPSKRNLNCPNKVLIVLDHFVFYFCTKQKYQSVNIRNCSKKIYSTIQLHTRIIDWIFSIHKKKWKRKRKSEHWWPGCVRDLRSPTELTTRTIKDAIGGLSLVRLDISGNNLTNKTLFFSTDKCLQFTQNKNKTE